MKAAHITTHHDCYAYLIRLWRDVPDEPWRASVKLVADERELHFASPDKLFLFLHEQTMETNLVHE